MTRRLFWGGRISSRVFRSEVVAKLKARIDDTNLEKSVPAVVKRFRCSTTNDTEVVLGRSYFESGIRSILLERLHDALRAASYQKLLQDSSHRDEIESNLVSSVRSVLESAGWMVIECRLHRFA